MKELRPDPVERDVAAVPGTVWAVLDDVERYPEWLTGVRSVEVRERDDAGRVAVARVGMELPIPVVKGGFSFTGAIEREPQRRLVLRRRPSRSGDEQALTVEWDLAPAGAGTRVRLAVEAVVDVPRFAPLGGPAESLERGFVDALERRVAAA